MIFTNGPNRALQPAQQIILYPKITRIQRETSQKTLCCVGDGAGCVNGFSNISHSSSGGCESYSICHIRAATKE